MRIASLRFLLPMTLLVVFTAPNWTIGDEVIQRVDERFADKASEEIPSFQKHVVPLFGRLGCNGRACHGSFQGQGGFQLSLFGYDFQLDHEALHDKESPRVNVDKVAESLIIAKPTDEDMHEGGQRYEIGSWEHHVIANWVKGGAKFEAQDIVALERLEITPSEIVFAKTNEETQLQVVAVWADGTREDVTPLCRYQSNNTQVASIDNNGHVVGNEAGDTHLVVFYDKAVVPVPIMRPVSDQAGANYPQVATRTQVDQLVVKKLQKLGVVPSEICSDAEFLRRVKLDLTGTLPTSSEVKAFLADKAKNKRAKLVDTLLETPAYAAWWATKLCDFTGNNDQQVNNVLPTMRGMRAPASQAWYDWIHRRVEENAPYDKLVEGIVTAQSIQPGQTYQDYCKSMCDVYQGEKSFADFEQMPFYWARRDFRTVEPRAINFAYAFLGIRIQCAQCHKHPFDQWSKDDFAQFTGFFSEATTATNRPPAQYRKDYDKILAALDIDKSLRGNQMRRELSKKVEQGKVVPFNIVYVNKRPPTANRNRNKKAPAKNPTAKLLGSDVVQLNEYDDARVPLMDWLRNEQNPYFTTAFVNRVWAAYFNRGIVEPPDDMSLANPPSNKPLLDYLARGFYENNFDMKWVHRTILNSDTYQRSWVPNETNVKDEANFSHAIPRRLPAEVVYDAIVQATASSEKAEQLQADLTGRAIAIPGSNGQNRNTAGNAAFALTVFGRSTRESNCDCDRAMDPSLLQTVYLQNDRDIQSMLVARGSWIDTLARKYQPQPKARTPQRPKNYDQLVRNFRTKIAKLKERGADKQLIQQQQKRLQQFIARYKVEEPSQKANPQDFDAKQVIEEAYLRSVSRLPNDKEMARCEQHVGSSDNQVDAIKDILWALLNTKEFIVNH